MKYLAVLLAVLLSASCGSCPAPDPDLDMTPEPEVPVVQSPPQYDEEDDTPEVLPPMQSTLPFLPEPRQPWDDLIMPPPPPEPTCPICEEQRMETEENR